MNWVENKTVLKVIVGSRGYGLHTETSDTDIRGVCIPPTNYLLGVDKFEQYEDPNEDTTIFSLVKLVNLAMTANPNILEILFTTKSENILKITSVGKELQELRFEFLTKQCANSYIGYATAQLHRLKNHKQWIEVGLEKPDRESMGLPVNPLILFGELENLKGKALQFLKDEMQEYVKKELSYIGQKKDYDRYQVWIKERNPVRFELEKKHLMDTKHAMQLVRLLYSGIEILETGNLEVYRSDRDFLLGIRNGSMSYEELMSLAEGLKTRIRKAEELTKLPEHCNTKKINAWLLQTLKNSLSD